jgi:hypothetical protein
MWVRSGGPTCPTIYLLRFGSPRKRLSRRIHRQDVGLGFVLVLDAFDRVLAQFTLKGHTTVDLARLGDRPGRRWYGMLNIQVSL